MLCLIFVYNANAWDFVLRSTRFWFLVCIFIILKIKLYLSINIELGLIYGYILFMPNLYLIFTSIILYVVYLEYFCMHNMIWNLCNFCLFFIKFTFYIDQVQHIYISKIYICILLYVCSNSYQIIGTELKLNSTQQTSFNSCNE